MAQVCERMMEHESKSSSVGLGRCKAIDLRPFERLWSENESKNLWLLGLFYSACIRECLSGQKFVPLGAYILSRVSAEKRPSRKTTRRSYALISGHVGTAVTERMQEPACV